MMGGLSSWITVPKQVPWTMPTARQPPAEAHLNKKEAGGWFWEHGHKRFLFSLGWRHVQVFR